MHCPYCGCDNDAKAVACQGCGAAIGRGRCGACGAPVPAGRDLCFACHMNAETDVDRDRSAPRRTPVLHDPEDGIRTVVVRTDDPEATSRLIHRRSLAGQEWTFHGVRVPFVGRRAQGDLLHSAWTAAASGGRLGVVVVRGPDGIGKTRFVEDARRRIEAEGPTPAAVYRASPPHIGGSGDLLGELLRQRLGLGPDTSLDEGRTELIRATRAGLSEEEAFSVARLLGVLCRLPLPGSSSFPLAGDVLRERTWAALSRFLAAEAAGGPVLIWIDDYDQAGAEEVRALRAVTAGLADSAVLLVVSGRNVGDPPVTGVEPTRIALGPLSGDEARRLLAALLSRCPSVPPALERLVLERSAGNPRALDATARVLVSRGIVQVREGAWSVDAHRLAAGEVPGDLDGLLRVRLEGLRARDRLVLEAAALQGPVFRLGGVMACLLAEDPPGGDFWLDDAYETRLQDALGRLISGDLVLPVPGQPADAPLEERRYRFVDPHAHGAALAGADEARLLRWHRIVASWLERRPQAKAEAAGHWEAGDRPGRAGRCHLAAGDAAAAAFRNEEAVVHFTRALEQLDEIDLAERAAARHGLGVVRHVGGDYKGAVLEFSAMLREAAVGRDPAVGALALRRLGSTWRDLGDWERALRALHRAKELYEEASDLSGVATCLEDLGKVLLQRGSPRGRHEAHANFELALRLRREADDEAGMAQSYHYLGWVFADAGRFPDARRCYEEAIRIRRAVGDMDGLVRSLNNLGDMYVDVGQHDLGRRLLHEALAACDEIGHGAMRPTVLGNLARSSLDTQDVKEAATWLQRAEAAAEGMDDPVDRVELDLLASRLLQSHGEQDKAFERVRSAAALVEGLAGADQQGAVLRRMGELVSATLYDPLAADTTGGRAEDYFKRSLELLQASGNEIEMARTLDAYGRYLVERGRPDPGNDYRRRAARILGRTTEELG